MRRPFKDKRPIGPFTQSGEETKNDIQTIGILFIAQDGMLIDFDEAQGKATGAISRVESALGQPIEVLEPWRENQVKSVTGESKEGVYIVAKQIDAAFGKKSPTSNEAINNVKKELRQTIGMGRMENEWYIISNPTTREANI